VFGGAGSAPSARAKDRAMTRDAMLKQRDAVLRDASERVAALASDKDFAVLLEATEKPDAPIDQGALDPAVIAVKRGFVEAVWDHMTRYARSNSFILCRQGERSFCP
jgi:ketopantoate reductase